ncbi:kinase-like protein [Teratosphaeria destructans]|uniref:EKC/KEOPS complex subunit BUD32 n=1 Tax=Teratosphaeria destructans TaxID=418781 RepID=A0A9W7SLW8_9PEZI|nr:kinase-like protein [Teratosphaeria destructans]
MNPIDRAYLADWQPSGVQRVFACSAWSWVGLMDDGRSVLKYPRRQGDKEAMQTLYDEAARYKHVGPHGNLVVFKGVHRHGLIFELCEKGSLADVIQFQQQAPLTDADRLALGKQITRCLLHPHARNLIHGDVSVRNVFVTAGLVAKVGALQGQLYGPDGHTIALDSFTNENAQSRHPFAGEDEFSPRTDIFALGTLLYCLWHGDLPFPDLNEFYDEAEIQARYRRGEYPLRLAEATGMDEIICRCWHSRYSQMGEVLNDMEELVAGSPANDTADRSSVESDAD